MSTFACGVSSEVCGRESVCLPVIVRRHQKYASLQLLFLDPVLTLIWLQRYFVPMLHIFDSRQVPSRCILPSNYRDSHMSDPASAARNFLDTYPRSDDRIARSRMSQAMTFTAESQKAEQARTDAVVVIREPEFHPKAEATWRKLILESTAKLPGIDMRLSGSCERRRTNLRLRVESVSFLSSTLAEIQSRRKVWVV